MHGAKRPFSQPLRVPASRVSLTCARNHSNDTTASLSQAACSAFPIVNSLFLAEVIPRQHSRAISAWIDVGTNAVFRIVLQHLQALSLGQSLQRNAAMDAKTSQLASLCHELRCAGRHTLISLSQNSRTLLAPLSPSFESR